MTVTKGKKNYSFPVGSAQSSDVESLQLGSTSPSDNESSQNEPIHNSRLFTSVVQKSTDVGQMILKKHSGRKKLRRYQNRYSLQTLTEDEGDEGTLIVIMEPYKTPFSRLLEDTDALQFWNMFIEKSEEEQAEFFQILSSSYRNHNSKIVPRSKHARISTKIKRTIKMKRNLSLEQVRCFEDDLIEFFKETPDQVYVKSTLTYFERLLLHAVAEYHGLQSLGMVEDGCKRIEVYNTTENWVPADCYLVDFIVNLQK